MSSMVEKLLNLPYISHGSETSGFAPPDWLAVSFEVVGKDRLGIILSGGDDEEGPGDIIMINYCIIMSNEQVTVHLLR